MAFWDDLLNVIGSKFQVGSAVNVAGILLKTAAGAVDLWKSDSNGAGLVSDTGNGTKLDTLHTDLGHLTDNTQTCLDVTGAAAAWGPATVAAAADTGVIKNSPGTLYSLLVTNVSTSAIYFQLFDATSAPVNGTVPRFVMIIPASSTLPFSFDRPRPVAFTTGISWASSSTGATKTATASNAVLIHYEIV